MRNLKTGENKRGGHRFNGTKPGPGRPPGRANKITRDVREMIAAFAERKAEDFERWIERTAVKDPGKAATLYLAAIEYHIPRLQRTDVLVTPAAFSGEARVVVDQVEAMQAYQEMTRQQRSPESVRFLPGPQSQHQPSAAGPPRGDHLVEDNPQPVATIAAPAPSGEPGGASE
jgi:hypothetical protein